MRYDLRSLRLKQLGLLPATRRDCSGRPGDGCRPRGRRDFAWITWPTNHTAHSLACELRDQVAEELFFCRAAIVRIQRLPGRCAQAGARVTDVVAYRTTAPDDSTAAILEPPSERRNSTWRFSPVPRRFITSDGFLGVGTLRELARRTHFAAIGPTTAKAMMSAGVRVHIEAEEATSAGLAERHSYDTFTTIPRRSRDA